MRVQRRKAPLGLTTSQPLGADRTKELDTAREADDFWTLGRLRALRRAEGLQRQDPIQPSAATARKAGVLTFGRPSKILLRLPTPVLIVSVKDSRRPAVTLEICSGSSVRACLASTVGFCEK